MRYCYFPILAHNNIKNIHNLLKFQQSYGWYYKYDTTGIIKSTLKNLIDMIIHLLHFL